MTEALDKENFETRLSTKEKRMFFEALRMEVVKTFKGFDPTTKRRLAGSARKLIEILQLFERDPYDSPHCSIAQVVDLACQFTAQGNRTIQTSNTSATLH
ncbi:hypothetical protein [Rhizobium sp. ZW T2_16]|uniref:hypothetical protein n=1 Tax=Rhizobium sp. ZW T2_16 TaxID=3378083 RepID=UPI000F95DADE